MSWCDQVWQNKKNTNNKDSSLQTHKTHLMYCPCQNGVLMISTNVFLCKYSITMSRWWFKTHGIIFDVVLRSGCSFWTKYMTALFLNCSQPQCWAKQAWQWSLKLECLTGYIIVLDQDCGNTIANTLQLLCSYTEPFRCLYWNHVMSHCCLVLKSSDAT